MADPKTIEANAYLAAIVESSDDAIVSKDLNGIIQSCNPATERIFGYAADELVGQSIRILIPKDRQSEEDEILRRLRAGERIDHFETARLAKGGRPVDISLSVSPVRDRSGAVIGVAKIARDITEQKRLAHELSAQQEWFRVTLGSIGDAVIASGPEGRITFMNAAAEALTGWPLLDALGVPLADVFHIISEKTRLPVDNPASLVMRLGSVVGLANHTLLIDRHGGEHPIADSAAPIRDDDGRILGVVLVFRDVTEERRTEDAMAEQREWFETTLESIGDAVIATDVQGHVVFMNTIAEHLTGWRMAQANGKLCTEVFRIVNEDTRRVVESPVTRVLAEGAVVGLANHTILISLDGIERPIDDSGAPIRNREGRIVGVVLVFRDVSERRRLELERREAASERERLLEAERAARTDAERASRLKDEFVAMVSHELRTPLNAILGWTHLLTQPGVAADVAGRAADVIARNTRVQAQLISDLLDISRITSGKLRLEITDVDLAAVIAESMDAFQHEAARKRIDLRRELADGAPGVAGDPRRLQQVLSNLLSNAVKFTPEGGAVVVRLRRNESNAEITVSDTGVGIQSEFLPYVFDRFHQADRSITRRFGGLGLGLSIAKHLVELHGGSIAADSDGPDRGSVFTVLLPVAAEDRQMAVTPGDGKAAAGTTDSLDGISLLIVEDEADTADYLERFLRSHGARVTTARTSSEALEQLSRVQPNIIVSDIGLPDVDGYELMQRIRNLPPESGGAVPAIALTAYARTEDRTRALRAGYQAHLAKPVEPMELVATVASFAGLVDAQRRTREKR